MTGVPDVPPGHTASVAPRGAGPSSTVATVTGCPAPTDSTTRPNAGYSGAVTRRTSRVISPPHVSPTANASSSL